MQAAVAQFPTDLALRRQLWRQWVRFDPPQGDRGRAMPARKRSTRGSQILLPKARPQQKTSLRLIRRSVRPALPIRSVVGLVTRCVALEAIVVVGIAAWLHV